MFFFNFFILFYVEYVFSGESIYKKLVSLDLISEEGLLSLIAENNYNNSECETSLGNYCSIFNTINESYPIIKKLCEESDKKCASLSINITKQCSLFNSTFIDINENLTDDNCIEYDRKCLVLETSCPYLSEKCSILRNICYRKMHYNIIDEILLRVMNDGNLNDSKNIEKCMEKLALSFQDLSTENHELMKRVLYPQETCTNLVNLIEKKCKILKMDIIASINKITSEMCSSLLERCYFYKENCDGENKQNCFELEKKCKEIDVTYIPPGFVFNPIKPNATLSEKIDLKRLYEKEAGNGLFIEKYSSKSIYDILMLLTPEGSLNEIQKNCKNALNKNCKYFKKYDILENLCDNDKISVYGISKCDELFEKFQEKARFILKEIYFKKISTFSKVVKWADLHFYGSISKLRFDCFYIQNHFKNYYIYIYSYRMFLEIICRNIEALYYKQKLGSIAVEKLLTITPGKFSNIYEMSYKEYIEILVEKCQKLIQQNGEFTNTEMLLICLASSKSINSVYMSMTNIAIFMRKHLDEKRDFPSKEDCKELREKCENLHLDLNDIELPCLTLKDNCHRLEIIEKFEEQLFEQRIQFLENTTFCIEEAKKQCIGRVKIGNDGFSSICRISEFICRTIIEKVKFECQIFKENMKQMIIEKFNKNTYDNKEELCNLLMPYCNKLSPYCQELQTNENECRKLEKICEMYYQENVMDIIIKESKGHLDDKNSCKLVFDRFCEYWDKTENVTFKNLCSKRNNEKLRKRLCEKLVKRMQKKCEKLRERLEIKVLNIKKQIKNLKEFNKDAKKLLSNTDLFLLNPKGQKTKIVNNTNNRTIVSRRDINCCAKVALNTVKIMNMNQEILPKNIQIRTKDIVLKDRIDTFDAVITALNAYMKVETECKNLLMDCEFKETCSMCQDACNKTEIMCNELELLEIAPNTVKTLEIVTETKNVTVIERTVETKNKTITDIKTEIKEMTIAENITKIENITVTEIQKTTVTEGRTAVNITQTVNATYTLTHTVDTWVTHTLTDTSTSIYMSTLTCTSISTHISTSTQACIVTSTQTSIITSTMIPISVQ